MNLTDEKQEKSQSGFNKAQFFICLIMLTVWGGIMLTLSSQNGEQTAGLSFGIAEKLAGILFGNANFEMINAVHAVIRKLAHVFVYAVLGLMLNLLAASFSKFRNWLGAVISFIAVIVFSVTDEVHKLPISGRHCDFFDICLNIFGGAAGIVIIIVFRQMIKRFRKK